MTRTRKVTWYIFIKTDESEDSVARRTAEYEQVVQERLTR